MFVGWPRRADDVNLSIWTTTTSPGESQHLLAVIFTPWWINAHLIEKSTKSKSKRKSRRRNQLSCCWKLFRVHKERSGSRTAILIGRTRYYIYCTFGLFVLCNKGNDVTSSRIASKEVHHQHHVSLWHLCPSGGCWTAVMLMAKRDASGRRGNGLYYASRTLLLAGWLPSRVDRFYALPGTSCTIYLAASQQHTGWWYIGFGLIPFAQHHQIFFFFLLFRYYISNPFCVDLLSRYGRGFVTTGDVITTGEGESKVDDRKYVGSGWPGSHIYKHKGKAIN